MLAVRSIGHNVVHRWFNDVYFGVGWLASEPLPLCRTMGVFGIILAFLAFRKGFGKIANRNIIRLRRLPEQGCIFAFQAWKSYIIIFIMIVLGITLRQSPLPKSILAIIYITIGGGLFLSSFFYFKHVRRIIRTARLRHAAYIKKAKPNQGIN